MIIIKKFSSILVSLVVMFYVIPAQASTISNSDSTCFLDKDKANLIYEKKEITDEDKLFHMAIEGTGYLSDSEQQKFSGEANLVKEDTNELSSPNLLKSEKEEDTVQLQTYSTSQLLSEYEIDGQIYEEIAVTEFVIVQEKNLNNVTASELSDPGSAWDSSISVKVSATNYYTKSGNCIDLTRVSGSWTSYDKDVQLGTKTVYYGQVGPGCSGAAVSERSSNLYPGTNNYSYTVPSIWKPVLDDGVSLSAVGHTTSIKLARGSSTWTLNYNNNI